MANRRNVIAELGLTAKVISLMRVRNLIDNRDIAEAMMNDPEVKAVAGEQRIYPSHIAIFKDSLEGATQHSIDAIVRKDPEAKELVAQVHERIQRLVTRSDEADVLFTKVLSIVNKTLDDGVVPTKEIKTLLEIISTFKGITESLKNDDQIRNFIRNATMNVQTGMSIDEVFALIISVGVEMGKTRDETMAAFARARMRPPPAVIDIPLVDPNL